MAVTLKGLFESLQTQLNSSLQLSRNAIDHPTAKGSATENDWVKMLGTYLPARYRVETAFVIDSDGLISEQIDVVIFDRQYSPLLLSHGSCIYVPAESVYAVLEVKQDLSREHINYAGKKAASVRTLRRTNATIVHAGGVIQNPKPPFRIPAGIVATSSSWTPALGGPLTEALAALPANQQIDFGCAAAGGAFEAGYDGLGLREVNASADVHALVFFLTRLIARLQGLGTVPALDIGQYARWAGDASSIFQR